MIEESAYGPGPKGGTMTEELSREQRLARFITGMKFGDLSPRDLSVAKAGILDCLAVMISGSRSKTVALLLEEVQSWGGKGRAIVAGREVTLSPVWAALVNGTSAHAEHFDDANAAIQGHPSCVLVPGILAASSQRRLSGRDWIAAYACGFEIGARLGRAADPSLYAMGFHATTAIGVIMAASAASRLLGLDALHVLSALNISASLASGVRANFGTMTQALQVGHAASQGALAASLAARDFSSDPEAITGRYGFLDCFTGGRFRPEELDHLGNPFELTRSGIGFKFYPSGHPTVCAIEAALHLRERFGLSPESIREIRCFVGPAVKQTLVKTRPLTRGKEGKVNLPYCVAVALARGNVVEEDFGDEVLADPVVTVLRDCCRIEILEGEGGPLNPEVPARIEITLSDGRILAEERRRPCGSALNEPPWEALEKKFTRQAEPVLGGKATKDLVRFLTELEHVEDTQSITVLLTGK
jgi:2-methylcitrate dehydratase PrpD